MIFRDSVDLSHKSRACVSNGAQHLFIIRLAFESWVQSCHIEPALALPVVLVNRGNISNGGLVIVDCCS